MTIAYVNAGDAASGVSVTTLTMNLPASVTAGNLLFLIFGKNNTSEVTLPDGWTLVSSSTGTMSAVLAYKVASGSDVNPTITWVSSSSSVKGQVFQFSGANGIGASNSGNTGSFNGVPHACAAITTTKENSTAVYFDIAYNGELTTPSGWTSDFNSTFINVGHKDLTTLGSSSGSISTAGGNYAATWIVEINFYQIPIEAPAESTSSASSTSAGGLGIASAAESSGAAATESTYTFAKGAFATSSGIVSGTLSLIFEKAASAISSGILSQESLVAFLANADAVSTGVDASSVAVTRFTFELINTGITITGEVKASRIYYDIGSSSGNITSAVQVLRTMDASVIASALLETGAIGSASYRLIAESLAQMISGIVYVNDYVDGWAYNLNNQAPSFYENFKFNSFAKIGNDYFGLNASGLHIINANSDNGTPIEAVITTGISDFEDERTKKIQLIYANARTESALELTVRVDNEPEYSYDFISSSAGIAPTRVKLGKGLQGRNWQIEIKNKNGADFEISDLDIPVLPNSRRV